MTPRKKKSYKRALILALALVAGIVSRGTADPLPLAPGVSASLSATGMTLDLKPSYTGMVALQVTGTWAGALNPQCSVDIGSGATFEAINAYRATTGLGSQVITGNGIYRLDSNGCGTVRIQAGTISSGTAVLSMRAAPGALPPPFQNTSAALTPTFTVTLTATPTHTPTATRTNTPVVSATPTVTPTVTP